MRRACAFISGCDVLMQSFPLRKARPISRVIETLRFTQDKKRELGEPDSRSLSPEPPDRLSSRLRGERFERFNLIPARHPRRGFFIWVRLFAPYGTENDVTTSRAPARTLLPQLLPGRVCAPQLAGERPGIFGPVGAAHGNIVAAAIGAGPQKV